MTRKRHIVIVDDEANIGRSLRLILEGEGYRVSVFESATAFAAARSQAVADVYLLDVRLPDGSGSTCCGWSASGTNVHPR